MANISDKTDLNTTHGGVAIGDNWISQIKAGDTVYDIATHHGITFKDGSNGSSTVWNGLTDIEVVIPTVADIVQSPIVFAGTVDAEGNIEGNETHQDASSNPSDGYLIFFTANCDKFDDLSGDSEKLACEAGDMAVFANGKWNVISGENQVQIAKGGTTSGNTTTFAIGSAKEVLKIEGKTLSLELDYNELSNRATRGLKDTQVYVDISLPHTFIKLSKGTDKTINVTSTDIKVIEGLSNKEVKLTGVGNLIKGVTQGAFNPGSFPTIIKDANENVSVNGAGLTAVSDPDGYFVSSVSMSAVTFVSASDNDNNKITVVTEINASEGSEFLNGIHITDTNKNEKADIEIPQYFIPQKTDVSFVVGLSDNKTAVTSITSGSISLVDSGGSFDVVTGIGSNEGSNGDVLSSVTVTPTNNKNVFSSAVVSAHVLSFDTTSVPTNVSVEHKYKSLIKKGVQYTSPVATNTPFDTCGFTSVSAVGYTFDKSKETVYTPTIEKWTLNTPNLDINRGKYTLDNMNVSIPTYKLSEGTLPTLGDITVTPAVNTDLTATFDTEFTYGDDITINSIENKENIIIPGEYTLESDSTSGDIKIVDTSDTAQIDVEATVDLSSYIKGFN